MKTTVTPGQILSFQRYINRWYQLYGRHNLPWRQTTDPYQILVSELMLQQTQVERVVPKYLAFIKTFPTVQALADAEQATALKLWQGLGYNRRLLNLKKTALQLSVQPEFPQKLEKLVGLPGIGPYTASAITVFAFNQPTVVIETNIRTVMLHHFFPNQLQVSDSEIKKLIQATQDETQPRLWYSALMDYGSVLKKLLPNPSRRASGHTTQSKFQGSNRQVRGEILSFLTVHDAVDQQTLEKNIKGNPDLLPQALQQLTKEGFIQTHGSIYSLL